MTRPAETFNLAAAKESVVAANAEFSKALAAGDSIAISNLYTTDAIMMPANMPAVSGKSGIASFMGKGIRGGIGGLKLQTTELWGNDEMLQEVGTYSLLDTKGAEMDKGKFIVLWKKEDGKWKLWRDIFNSDNPPPPAKK